VKQWDGLAQRTLKRLGLRVTAHRVYQVLVLIQGETGGDPTEVNTTDSNARAGTPSKGLVQVIQPTFDMYRSRDLPNDLFDPDANLYAGLAYGIARYGSIEEIPGIKSVMNGGIYVPY
jgi:SLT domain-containing protein